MESLFFLGGLCDRLGIWINRACFWGLCLSLAGLLLSPPKAVAQDEPPPAEPAAQGTIKAEEHAVLAALLFNFGKFVTWPESVFERSDSPFRIGLVTGEAGADLDRLSKALRSISRRKTIAGRKTVVTRIDGTDALDRDSFHVIFFSEDAEPTIAELKRHPSFSSALTVGQSQSFLAEGGMIQMTIVDGRVALEINEAEAWAAELRISAGLLDIAQRVIPRSHEGLDP